MIPLIPEAARGHRQKWDQGVEGEDIVLCEIELEDVRTRESTLGTSGLDGAADHWASDLCGG